MAGATRFLSFYVYEVLLRKYIIFSLIFVLEGFKKLVIMGKRALGAPQNFGRWAIHTAKKTLHYRQYGTI
jgi:hypothetical protein